VKLFGNEALERRNFADVGCFCCLWLWMLLCARRGDAARVVVAGCEGVAAVDVDVCGGQVE
jgi:hypothetical protein